MMIVSPFSLILIFLMHIFFIKKYRNWSEHIFQTMNFILMKLGSNKNYIKMKKFRKFHLNPMHIVFKKITIITCNQFFIFLKSMMWVSLISHLENNCNSKTTKFQQNSICISWENDVKSFLLHLQHFPLPMVVASYWLYLEIIALGCYYFW